MKIGKKKMAIVGVIVVALLILSGGMASILSFFDAEEVEGVTYYSKGIAGGSVAGGAPNDLLDAESYVTSYIDGLSEKIVIRPYWKFYEDRPIVCSIEQTWVVVTLQGDGSDVMINGIRTTTWTSDRYGVGGGTVPDEQWQPLPSIILELKNPFSGGISVELWCYHEWDILLNSGDDKIASDRANLLPGIGSVDAQNDVIEEGTNANFIVETGYSHTTKVVDAVSTEGWYFDIYSLRTGTKVYSRTVTDDFYGTVSWLVPDGTFVTVGDNTHRAVLRNALLDIDFDDTFIIGAGMMDQIPELPTFVLIKGDEPFIPGESISVQMFADSNAITDSPIDGFWVNVFYETAGGSTTIFLLNHKWYSATPTATGGTATVSFTFPEAGTVRLTASAQDENNLNSGNSEMSWTVYSDGDGEEPPGDDADVDWGAVLIVIVCIAGVVFIYARAPLPEYIKWVIILILLAVAAYFMLGVIESLETGTDGG